jgi:predicted AAA+ superfamily ATPase
MYIHRQLEQEIAPFLSRREILAVIGPRQSGKTTFLHFLQHQLQEHKERVKFVTFEDKKERSLFEESIDDFKKIAEQYDRVIIDEFQYAADGGQKLKYLYDTGKTRFIISGSSSLDLTFQTGRYLVGRIFNFLLRPFSFTEFLSVKDGELWSLRKKAGTTNLFAFKIKNGFGQTFNHRLAEALEEYVLYGGYPAVVLAKTKAERQKVLASIADNYFLREIKDLLNLATDDELWRLTKILATQIGNLLNYQELSTTSSLNYPNLKKHLSILEKTYIVNLIKPFFTNPRTELVKNPKVYFTDLGLRNYFLDDFRPVKNRLDLGSLMENHAYNCLAEETLPVKYWRSKSGAEVDFVVEKNQQFYPVEIKYISRREIGKSLYSFLGKFRPKKAFVLTKDYLAEEKLTHGLVRFLPLAYLGLLLLAGVR